MSSINRPSFEFYPGDWMRDGVSGCSLAAQGLWLRIMILMHDSSPRGLLEVKGVPISDLTIARRCGCSVEEFGLLMAELDAAGVPSRNASGSLMSRRMVRDSRKWAENAAKRSEAGKAAAAARWKGVHDDECESHANRIRNALPIAQQKMPSSSSPSSSSSSSDSSEDKNLPQKERKRKPRTAFVPPSLEEVSAYCLERGRGIDPQAWLDHYISNGWRVGKNPMVDWRAAVRNWEKTKEHALGFKGGIPEKLTGAAKLPPSTVAPEFIMLWEHASNHSGLDRWFLAQTRLAHTPENRRKIHSMRNYHARKLDGADPDGKKTANNLHSDVKAWWQGRDFADMTNRDDWEAADAIIAGLEAGQ